MDRTGSRHGTGAFDFGKRPFPARTPMRRRRQKGAVAITVAFMMSILLGFAALAIDVGYLFVVRNELQNAADAAALAGAPCIYPRAQCGNTKTAAPDWATAQAQAVSGVSLNKSSNKTLTGYTSDVSYGYWDVTGSVKGLQTTMPASPAVGKPAVQVVVNRSGAKNGGVPSFLARIWGFQSVPESAVAVAVISDPGNVGSGAIFPVALTKCMYDQYWDSTNGKPKVATSTTPPGPGQPNQTVGQPYTFYVTSSYHAGPCEAGQWTTFDTTANDVPTVRNLISNGNPDPASIGSPGGVCSTPDATCTYIQPGTKTTLYTSVNDCSAAGTKACEYVLVPIVQDLTTTSYERILAFACVHIDQAVGGSGKYIQMEMSNNPDKCQASGAGGVGPYYGALTPARLVE
ncbi:pilus assembly protein TadG-related protein [Burkholderia territorii]|uniref:pilus assembly protein TadG-related protein n=1 Tax=Burkholderia territorii TaxID=1503055 RepID=UPI000AE58160|nr:pilus assembly protein TadG-related protein [Burkholderia territorii]